jgi:hypothetical protein
LYLAFLGQQSNTSSARGSPFLGSSSIHIMPISAEQAPWLNTYRT